MKQFAFFYIVVALIWSLAATLIGVNSTPGASGAYNYGRNFPGALIWPIKIIKSPYTFYKWATTNKRTEVFQGEYLACLGTMGNEKFCGCSIDLMEENFTESEIKTEDIQVLQGTPSAKYKTYVTEIGKQCR